MLETYFVRVIYYSHAFISRKGHDTIRSLWAGQGANIQKICLIQKLWLRNSSWRDLGSLAGREAPDGVRPLSWLQCYFFPLSSVILKTSFCSRVTMKMDVSYTDHSHIIGKGGNTIRRVMSETGCHIHFPDSNRSNPNEKSNQVSIAGSNDNSIIF